MALSRAALLACLCLGVSSPAVAQRGGGGHFGGGMRGGAGHGSTATPVPPGLPPPMGITPSSVSPFRPQTPPLRPGVDVFRATPKTYAPRFSSGPDGFRGHRDGVGGGSRWNRHRSGKLYPSGGAVYIGASPYYYPAYYNPFDSQIPQPVDAGPEEPEGFLRLMVTPRNARVFVDGVYEGTVDDFGGSGERVVRAGLHGVRIEADGFEPVEFDVRVPLNDTITLRRDLEPRRLTPLPPLPPPAAGPPAKPKTIYVIPRCYLGDSRPQQNALPAGCSLADLRTLN